MKATELRIGNLVYYMNEHNPVEISGIDRKQIHADGDWDYISEHKPIPLTEEWLERFGFNKLSDIWEFWKNSGWDLRQHKLENNWWLFYNGQDLDCVRIDYVHQLQNLYFALTGEELTIKE